MSRRILSRRRRLCGVCCDRERVPPRKVVLSFANKRKNQRKLPLFRRSGPATWGLHAPKTPNKEVAEGAGYANAVLLFALNARALCSVSKFGSSPEPPQGGRGRPPCQRGLSPLGDWGIPTGPASPPAHCKRGGLPPSLASLVRNPFTAVRRGRACPARSLAIVSPLSFAS